MADASEYVLVHYRRYSFKPCSFLIIHDGAIPCLFIFNWLNKVPHVSTYIQKYSHSAVSLNPWLTAYEFYPARFKHFVVAPEIIGEKIQKYSFNRLLSNMTHLCLCGGTATTSITNAAGIRLLAVSSQAQGNGIGRKLTEYCVELAKQLDRSRVILHTTQFMPAAWKLYQSMGFVRYTDIDFKQAELDVFGFQLLLRP